MMTMALTWEQNPREMTWDLVISTPAIPRVVYTRIADELMTGLTRAGGVALARRIYRTCGSVPPPLRPYLPGGGSFFVDESATALRRVFDGLAAAQRVAAVVREYEAALPDADDEYESWKDAATWHPAQDNG